MVMKKKLFACLECGLVEERKIVEERIDKKEKYHNTPPYPWREPEKHGIDVCTVCSECGTKRLLEFKSDCKLGYCGVKKIHYGGGPIRNECECGNKFSYKTDSYKR